MSIPLISIIAFVAVITGAVAYRLSGATRPNRRRSRDWSALADAPAVEVQASSAPADSDEEIDAYWGNQMPAEVASWSAERGLERVEAEEPPTPAVAEASPEPEEDALDRLFGSGAAAAEPSSSEMPASGARDDVDRVSLAEQQLGRQACRLGAAWLTHLLENGFLPTDSRGACNADDLRVALKALQQGQPTRILDHGAIVQVLGVGHYAMVEAFTRRVDNERNMLVAAGGLVGTDTLHVVVAMHDEVEPENTEHVPAVLQHFSVPPEHVVVLQDDGTFHSHLEDQAHYVPAHIDPWHVPETFVGEMMAYGQARFDAGEPEAALRTLGPLAGALWERATSPLAPSRFDKVLLAQVLNLLGVANRQVGATPEAATCFESALILLRDLEAYGSVQVVETNLGATLYELAATDADLYRLATRHLMNAVKLDQSDGYSWRLLGEAFLRRYESERSTSMLTRAEHAIEQALRVGRTVELEAIAGRIADLQAKRRSMDSLPGVSRPASQPVASQLALPLEPETAVAAPAGSGLRRESSG